MPSEMFSEKEIQRLRDLNGLIAEIDYVLDPAREMLPETTLSVCVSSLSGDSYGTCEIVIPASYVRNALVAIRQRCVGEGAMFDVRLPKR